jgi:hypothetical protein
MKLSITLFTVLAITIFLNACSESQCPGEKIKIQFVGYQETEADSLVLLKYKEGTNFNVIIDSLLFHRYSFRSDNFFSLFRKGDTLTFYTTTEKYLIGSGYDWKLRNLFDKKEIFVSDIITPVTSIKRSFITFPGGARLCISPIQSYKVNGVQVQPSPSGYDEVVTFKK